MPVAPVSAELTNRPQRHQLSGAPPGFGRALNAGAFDTRAPRVAALDGLRGVAIVAVVAFHAGVLPGGFLGVDLFFVLSGFLITGILLREQQQTGSLALRQFWSRRARRLIPAVLTLVGVVQIWARMRAVQEQLPVVNGQSAAAMVYGSNWFNILFDVGYWNVGPGNSPLNHLWSLAIEEQFYVLFPLVLVVALVRWKMRPRGVAWLALVLAIVSFGLTPLLFVKIGANRAYFGTDTRVGAILIGAALAAWLTARTAAIPNLAIGLTKNTENTENTKNFVLNATYQSAAIGLPAVSARFLAAVSMTAWASVLVMFVLWGLMTTASPGLYRGGFALHAVASLGIVAAIAMAPSGGLVRALQWRPLVWLGERSYSLYLWHWPLIVVLTPATTGLQGPMLFGMVALAISIATLVSYELVEHPIRNSNLHGLKLVTSLSVPAVVIAGSAMFFQPPPRPQLGTDALVTHAGTDALVAHGRAGTRVMLVGDSWAVKLGVALEAVDSAHHLSILNMGKGGCGIADGKRQRTPGKGEFDTDYDCLQWHRTWRSMIGAFRPEIAILSVGNWDQTQQDFDGTDEFVGACSALFAERYSRQLDTAIALLREQNARVFVMTVRDNDARDGSGPDCMNALLRGAATRHAPLGVLLLDLYEQLCTNHRCPELLNGDAVYDATGHLAPAAQRRIAKWVLNSVNATLSAR